MANKNFLIILTGLPASGKSTFSTELKSALKRRDKAISVKIIDPDKIRDNMNPEKFDYSIESQVRQIALENVRKKLEEGKIVISDDLNYYTSMRHELKEIADSLGIPYFIIYISTPLKKCLEWNEKRGMPIPQKVIKRIEKRFDLFENYQWDQPFRTFNLSKSHDIRPMIDNLVSDLFKDIESKQSPSLMNEKNEIKDANQNIEILEKITRQIVGEILKDPTSRHLKKRLLNIRKDFVQDLHKSSLNKEEIASKFKKIIRKELEIEL